MKAYLSYQSITNYPKIVIPGSKSESNRLLVLKALFSNLTIDNVSNSDDTIALTNGLKADKNTINIHHAGTAMRFLTAYFASKNDTEVTLTGSERMQERPIKILVDALKSLGADIEYEKDKGYPPLKIKGKTLSISSVNLNANISSQYISALMLIAPSLPNGLTIKLEGEITSVPYIEMTLYLLRQVGVSGVFKNDKIKILPLKSTNNAVINVESDWSSASYYYSLVALSDSLVVTLNNYTENSLQGDSEVASIYKKLGVTTLYNNLDNSIQLKKISTFISDKLVLNLNNTPDIAQTIAVSCFGLGICCELTGLKTLKIKETDRLEALKTELEKLGAKVEITSESIKVFPSNKIKTNVEIETYQDHRMAMAFAPLAIKTALVINNPNVVTKSYKTFWEDLKKVGVCSIFK